MSEMQSLFAVLTAIYLADCLVFVRRGAVLFRRLARDWLIVQPGSVLANAHGGIRYLSPWPRYPGAFLSTLPPCTFSPEGLLNWTPFCADRAWRVVPALRWIGWGSVKAVEVDRHYVMIARERFLAARSSQEAMLIAELIRSLAALEPAQRADAIEKWIRSTLDTAGLKVRLDEALKESSRLAAPAQLLACFLFVICPLLIYKLGLPAVGWWLLGGIYLQSAAIAVLLRRSHRKLYPKDDDERFVRVCTALLAPLSAIRAPDALTRNALQGFHPLPVARLLCPAPLFRAFAGELYRDVRSPILPDSPSEQAAATQALAWSRGLWEKAVATALDECGLSREELLAPPIQSEAVNRSYCPRCHEQFTDAASACADCGNRKTVPWP